MTKAEIQNSIAKIKDLIAESDLDGATEKLSALSENLDEATQKEAIQISSKWSDLDRKIRGMLIKGEDASIQKNQLIDQILDFVKDLEKGKTGTKKAVAAPASNTKWYVLGAVLIGIIIFTAYNIFNKEKTQEPGEPAVIESVNTPQEQSTPAENPATRPAANAQKKQPSESPGESQTPQRPALQNNPGISESPSETLENAPVRVIEDGVKKEQKFTFKELYNSGVKAYEAKDYQSAFASFTLARKQKDTDDIQQYLINIREKLYRQFFTEGMDYYNDKKYRPAMTSFKNAQHFKDITQVKGMIKRCKKQIEME